MNRAWHNKLESLFAAVVGLDRVERARILDRDCGHDTRLRREVEALVVAYWASSPGLLRAERQRQAAPRPASELPSPGDRVGPYTILHELGRGGMGAVYLARDTELDRQVAIKFILDRDPDFVSWFRREARALARCRHENIVVIHAIAEHRGAPYMVLEYHAGQTLEAWLHGRGEPLPPKEAITLMVPVVNALEYAHERGIVHRDLKPGNIMLTDAGAIKVLDFGLAMFLSSGLSTTVPGGGSPRSQSTTDAERIMGTLPYMSPEQWRADEIDARSDLWALGIILFEMITGHHPLARYGFDALRSVADLSVPMPRVGDTNPELGALADLIDACLVKDKHHRIPSARALRLRLEALGNADGDAPADMAASPPQRHRTARVTDSANGQALEIASVALARPSQGWRQQPERPHDSPFAGQVQLYLHLDAPGATADLPLDITMLNLAGRPLTLTYVGLEIVALCPQFQHLAGDAPWAAVARSVPAAGKIRKEDTHVIDAYELFRLIRPHVVGHLRQRHTAALGKPAGDENGAARERAVITVQETAWSQLDAPVYLAADAPYRFGLLVRGYASCVPDHMRLRVTARTQLGDEVSGIIETCTSVAPSGLPRT